MENKVISFKIVYYGPGLSGKTTNLAYIHSSLSNDLRGEMLTLNTDEDRTLFFDFFPLDLGKIGGYSVRFNMYTVPGQIYYEASRKLILDGSDGVVFVADSQPDRLEDNIVSFHLMEDNLRSYDRDPRAFPIVLQYNKRDCPHPTQVGVLEKHLNIFGIPVYEAVAIRGQGVMETIRTATRMVVKRFHL